MDKIVSRFNRYLNSFSLTFCCIMHEFQKFSEVIALIPANCVLPSCPHSKEEPGLPAA